MNPLLYNLKLLLSPGFCAICSVKCCGGQICDDCFLSLQDNLIPEENYLCSVCKINHNSNQHCKNCDKIYHNKITNISLYRYQERVVDLIHQLKYNNSYDILNLMYLSFKEIIFKWLLENNNFTNTVLIPTPSLKKSIIKRGFNHIHKITSLLSKELGIDIYILEELDDNRSISTKTNPNLRSHFGLKKYKTCFDPALYGMDFIIIDDVITTGATVFGIYEHLRQYHPNNVFILTIARSNNYTKYLL